MILLLRSLYVINFLVFLILFYVFLASTSLLETLITSILLVWFVLLEGEFRTLLKKLQGRA